MGAITVVTTARATVTLATVTVYLLAESSASVLRFDTEAAFYLLANRVFIKVLTDKYNLTFLRTTVPLFIF